MSDDRFCLDEFELYRAARAFRVKTYRVIKQLPTEEKYCLGVQMRKAAVSVSNNVTEGHGRWQYVENMRFCRISRGSVEELIEDFNVCLDEHYGDQKLVAECKSDAYALLHRINGYIAYLQRVKQGGTTQVSRDRS
jgi:four helix bundle protein